MKNFDIYAWLRLGLDHEDPSHIGAASPVSFFEISGGNVGKLKKKSPTFEHWYDQPISPS